MSLKWNGDAVKAMAIEAAAKGIDKTISEASIQAKMHHPGFRNRTGTLEGSVRPVQFAKRVGSRIVGIWGSVDVDYAIWVELKHGSFLRSAAVAVYPRLAGYIREFLK